LGERDFENYQLANFSSTLVGQLKFGQILLEPPESLSSTSLLKKVCVVTFFNFNEQLGRNFEPLLSSLSNLSIYIPMVVSPSSERYQLICLTTEQASN